MATTGRRTPRKAPRRNGTATVLRKPVTLDDVSDLLDLAERLRGRPVPDVRMTEDEFEAWCDEDVKAEWVDGEVVLMSPENLEHVALAQWITHLMVEFVRSHDLGEVIGREFQVRLPRQRRRRCPDLLFVAKARSHLLHPTYLDGAPDLAVEIVSPNSMARDWRDKYGEYEKAGVREYWIIDPLSRAVEVHALSRGKKFRPVEQTADGRLNSAVLAGFFLKPEWLWSRPRIRTLLKQMDVHD
jgi:Uma2 family endonuclease